MKIASEQRIEIEGEAPIASMDFNRHIKRVSIGDEKGNIYILKPTSSDEKESKFSKFPIQKGSCIVDHKWLNRTQIAYTDQNKIKIFDVQKGRLVSTFIGHQSHVLCLKDTPSESYFLSGGDDSCLFAWDKRNVKPSNFILAHSSSITSLDCTEDGSVVLTTSDEGYARTWDIHDGICLSTSMLSNSPALSNGKFCKNPKYCLLSCLDGRTEVYDTKNGTSIARYGGYENSDFLIETDFLKIGNVMKGFVVGSENGFVHFFDFNGEKKQHCISEVGGTIDFVRVIDEGQCVASGRNLKYVSLLQMA